MARHPLVFAAALMLVAPALQSSPVQAQEAAPVREEIRVLLTAEDWVATETAEVDLLAQLTLVGQDPAAVRRDVMAAFKRIEDAPWRIVSFARHADPSGAERWTIVANARLSQARLDGLHERARGAGGTGKAFHVARVDTAPSLAEREAVLRTLRGKLYQMARGEIDVAKALWPGRTVGVARIEFLTPGQPAPRPVPFMARTAESGGAAAPQQADATTTERKIELRAWVTLAPAQVSGR